MGWLQNIRDSNRMRNACIGGDETRVRALLADNWHVDSRELSDAVENGNTTIVRLLLDKLKERGPERYLNNLDSARPVQLFPGALALAGMPTGKAACAKMIYEEIEKTIAEFPDAERRRLQSKFSADISRFTR
jgi:hypothetical protein